MKSAESKRSRDSLNHGKIMVKRSLNIESGFDMSKKETLKY